jgi:hypothetical protein
MAAAAEIELQTAKHGSGAGQLHGDLAYGLAGVRVAGVGDGVHGGFLKIHLI